MKKLLLILIFLSTNLHSQNVDEDMYVCGNTFNGDELCVVKNSLTINEDIIIYWMVKNLKEPEFEKGIGSYRSMKFKILQDCKLDRFKFLVVNTYDSSMGKGKLVNTSSDDEWIDPEPKNFWYGFNKDLCKNFIK